jgi:acetoin utilization deacetylase AcuC-like enzyme
LKAYYSDHYVLPLPPGHKFPMGKYEMLRRLVGTPGVVPGAELVAADRASDEDLLRAHDPEYIGRVARGELDDAAMRRIGFPWSEAMVERSRRSSAGTVAACRTALREGVSVNLAGGTHHAFASRGEGFCVFNDTAVAARALQADGSIRRALVIDCDVHQGNGTASIFSGDDSVVTYSIHGANNFPYRKELSDVDVPLADGTRDEEYLAALSASLPSVIRDARADLAIFVTGADPHENDRFGRLKLTAAGIAARDRYVFAACRDAGIPVAASMAGGYGRDVSQTAAIHLETVRVAAAAAEAYA